MTQHSPAATDEMDERGHKGLTAALRAAHGANAVVTIYQVQSLQNGTVGDVRLITGFMDTAAGSGLPFRVVQKTQSKWERPGDPGSWRREYDLYRSGLDALFDHALRWPACYHAEMNDAQDETRIWTEYIDGASGYDLTPDMLEGAAYALGRFQGRLYAARPDILDKLTNLSDVLFVKNRWLQIQSWQALRGHIQSDTGGLPAHLRRMLMEAEAEADHAWQRIQRLPIVLCHRDFWVTNILGLGDSTVLIDWDTAGWGHLGEDIASLMADEPDVPRMLENYRRCVPAYLRGFSEHADVPPATERCIRDMMLFSYGFRLAAWHMTADTGEGRALQVETLQKIFEIRAMP